MKGSVKKIITNQKFAIFGVVFGPAFGMLFSDVAEQFMYINDIYLTLMQIAVIPLIIVTVMIGVLDLSTNDNAQKEMLTIISGTFLLLILTAVLAITVVLIVKPWVSMMDDPSILSIVYEKEPSVQPHTIGLNDVIVSADTDKVSFGEFIKSAIPSNVFRSLSQGDILQALLFFGIFAAGMGVANADGARSTKIRLIELKRILEHINDSILQYLPFLSFFIISYQLHLLSPNTLYALIHLALCIILVMTLLATIFMGIIFFKSKQPFMVVLRAMTQCIVLAFLSRSTIVTSSLALKVLVDELKFAESSVQLTVPIGAGLLRFGSLSIYFIAAILAAFLFHSPFTLGTYVTLGILSVLAMFVSLSTNNSVAFYQTLSVVMTPLGLPPASVQSIMLSVDVITEPLEVINNVLGICALAALCSHSANTKTAAPESEALTLDVQTAL